MINIKKPTSLRKKNDKNNININININQNININYIKNIRKCSTTKDFNNKNGKAFFGKDEEGRPVDEG
jgi:hypothetical protein